MDIYSLLINTRKNKVLGKLAYFILKILGAEIPVSVQIGKQFNLLHGGFAVVIHPCTIIGNRVRIYTGVTIGRADVYKSSDESKFEGVLIEDDVIIGTGAKVLCKEGVLTVGKGTIIGANAVLTKSTGNNEIWGGVPARCISHREPPVA